MTDLIVVAANDPILMDAASHRSGFAFRQLIPPERGVLPAANGDSFRTPFGDFTRLCLSAVWLQYRLFFTCFKTLQKTTLAAF